MADYKSWLQIAKDDLRWTENSINGKVFYGACFSAQRYPDFEALSSFTENQAIEALQAAKKIVNFVLDKTK